MNTLPAQLQSQSLTTDNRSSSGSPSTVKNEVKPANVSVKPFNAGRSGMQDGSLHWWMPGKMLGSFVLAIGLAIGHHLYYSSLDNQEIGSQGQQEWTIRYGTAFALLVRVFFATAITGAYTQYLWTSFRAKTITVSGLDAAISAVSDVTSFLNPEFYRKFLIGVALALSVWLIPLSAVATPATLSTTLDHQILNQPIRVPTLNVTAAKQANDDDAASLSIYMDRLFTMTYSMLSPMTMPAIVPNATGATYETEFHGPLLTCRPLNDTENRIMSDVLGAAFALRSYVLGPARVILKYFVIPTPSTYVYFDTISEMHRVNTTEFIEVMGGHATTMEGILSYPSGPHNNTPYDWFWVYTPGNSWACSGWNATFQGIFELGSQGTQTIRVKDEETVLEPVSNDAYNQIFFQIWMVLSGSVFAAVPKSTSLALGRDCNDIYTTWSQTRVTSTGLYGALHWPDDTFEYGAKACSFVLNETAQMYKDWSRNKTLDFLIQELSLNYTLNFFSQPTLWSDPEYYANTTISIPRTVSRYRYNAQNLILSYSVAAFVSLLAILVGAWAFYTNGVAYSTSFSAIIQTTRNPTLDDLVRSDGGSHLGALPVSKSWEKTALRFGILKPSDTQPVIERSAGVSPPSAPAAETGSPEPKVAGTPTTAAKPNNVADDIVEEIESGRDEAAVPFLVTPNPGWVHVAFGLPSEIEPLRKRR